MMVSRVSLLLLVTGLFAGMWSADSPDGRTVARQQLARRASSPRAVGRADTSTSSRVKSVSLSGRLDERAIPRPRGIAPGTYLVVDQAGTTQRLTITARHGDSANHAIVEQYTARSGDARWHFIRLEERTPAGPTHPATAAVPR